MNEETRLAVRRNWLCSLFEFAHLDFQKRLWLDASYPDIIGDYSEAICSYFNDLNLEEGYNSFVSEGIVTQQEYEIVKDFHSLLDNYVNRPEKRTLSDKHILKDIEWINLTNLAKANWENLKTIIQNKDDLEFMNAQEKQYLATNTTETNKH